MRAYSETINEHFYYGNPWGRGFQSSCIHKRTAFSLWVAYCGFTFGGGIIFSLSMVAWAVMMAVQGGWFAVVGYVPFLVGLLLVAGVSFWDDVRSLESGTVILEMKDGAYEPIQDCDILK